jgi:hypothetical protein
MRLTAERVKIGRLHRSVLMALDDRTRAWFREERESLLRQLQALQSGTVITGEKRPPATVWVDTTTRDMEQIRRRLGDLDALLARHPSE